MTKLNLRSYAWQKLLQAIFIFVFVCTLLGVSPGTSAEAQGDSSLPAGSGDAAPLSAPLATVTLSVPPSVQIGQAFSFTATFDNTDPTDPGYGPFIDLYFPVTGIDGAGPGIDDGIDFVNATFLGAPVSAVSNTFGAAGTGGCIAPLGPVTHPYAITFPTGAAHIVCGTPGDKMVTLQLPFGSFTPSQPAAVVTVNATLSALADANTTLNIRARGGYQFGATPLNDWCCTEGSIVSQAGPGTTWPASPVAPTLLSLTKTYNGPEEETATGPNYPRQYTLAVDIASGQQVTSLIVTDTIPINMQYVSVAGSSPVATCSTVPTPLNTPGGTLTCNFGTVTGGAGANDATVTFNFYIPLNNSGAAPVINAASGNDAPSQNSSSVTGSWDPIDTRDPLTPVTAGGVCPTGCHDLTDKSIAIQKAVANVIDTGSVGNSPGDILQYTLQFQVSDFFSFQNVVISDILSDGQHFRSSFAPRLTVNGNTYIIGPADMDSNNVNVVCNYTGNLPADCDADAGVPYDGTTSIDFNISQEIIDRGQDGKLIGGCVETAGTGAFPPNCNTADADGYNDGSTTGVLVFQTVIQDQFTDIFLPPFAPPNSPDSSVDHGDVLSNNVTVNGDLLSVTNNSTVTGQSEADTSSAGAAIAFGALAKSVYAVNGTSCEPCTTQISTDGVSPGDTLTFRLRYTQPSSDFEQTTITDYLPLPIFEAATVGSFSNSQCGTPASGAACLGPADTYHLMPSPVTPVMSTNVTNNTVSFVYPAYDNTSNTSSEIDLLFTVTLSDEPFADGLFLTNQANASEGTTNAGDQELNAILQIKINEPVLIPTKSAVSTDSTAPGITFVPAIGAPIAFDVPGVVDGSADWSGGVINSNYLAANLIDADLTGIDGGDLIKFAIVIENTGNGVAGAFDIAIRDAMPAELQIPLSGLNLEVFLGDGITAITYEDIATACVAGPGDPCGPDGLPNTADDLFGSGIKLVDPGVPASGACQAHDDTSGQNIIIITYDLQLRGTGIMNPDIINTTTLLSYSSSEGGTNFIPSGVTDTAEITPALPSLAKSLKSTSESHTSDVSNPPRVAIGEIVRYRLSVTLPEGSFTNFQIDDNLPTGLVYIDDGTARVAFISNGTGISSATTGTLPVVAIPGACVVSGNALTALPDPLPCVLADSNVGINNSTTTDADIRSSYTQGLDPQFKLGDIVNADSDSDSEFVVIEFNALVDNSAAGGNDLGDNRDNNFGVNVNGLAYGAVSADLRVRISEPSITNLVKGASPSVGDAGDNILYTITFSNANTANNTTAFDVNLTDVVPAKMTLNLPIPAIVFTPAACSSLTTNTSAGNNINLIFGTVPAGCAITLTYQATLLSTVIPGEALTNTANLIYTSLPGTHGTTGNPTGSQVDDLDIATTNDAPGGDKGERTGSAAPAHNDYFDSDQETITVDLSSSAKSFIITSETFTSDIATPPQVTIGEIIRYRLISPIPEGTSPNFQVVDLLPSGLTFLNDGTAAVVFVSDGGIASAAAGTSVPAVSGVGCTAATIPPFNSLTCLLADGNVSSSSDINNNFDTYGTSDDIYFRLGNLTNSDSDSGLGTPGTEYIVIEFNALVDNTIAGDNDAGETRDNFARTYINGAPSGPISNIVTVRIVEPSLSPTKTATPNQGDAGDVIQYVLVFTNTAANNSTAWDVTLTDTVPGKMTANLGTMTIVQSPLVCANGQSNTSSGNNVNITFTSVPVGCTVTATYTATLNATVTAGEVIANAVTLTYSSLPGTGTPAGTGGNTTGSTTPGGTDDVDGEREYNDLVSDDVTITPLSVVKSIVGSSNGDTSGSNLTIGEVVTYRLVTDIPEGTQAAFTIADTLPAGLTYVAGSPRISFIANVNVTTVPDLSGANDDLTTPVFTLPSGHVNVSGQNITFALNDIINNDTDSVAPDAIEQVVIDFEVLVNNDANNNNTNIKNNHYTVTINDGLGVPQLRGTSPDVAATIVEPILNVAKSANDSTWLYGQTVQYTLDVTHVTSATPALASAAPAYDIVLTDTIPTGLTFVAAPPLTLPANWTYSYSAPTLTLSCLSSNGCSLPVGNSAQLQFTVTVDSPPIPPALDGSASATNNVGMVWTSLPGTDTNERDGNGTPVVNDYNDTASHFGGLEYYALGNRVWFDTNNSAAINVGIEVGVDNVRLELYYDTGAPVLELDGITPRVTTTNASGYYLFDYLDAGNYVVVIPNSNFTGTGRLVGYWSSTTVLGATGALSETAAPDVDITATDSDDNGTQTSFLSTREVRSLPVTLGPVSTPEPINETDLNAGSDGDQPDTRANMTVDFGFYRTTIGDLVWLDDVAVDGAYVVGETLVNGAAVSLYSTNGTEIPVGADGVLGTPDDAAGGVTTGNPANGWANGIYIFSGLPSGSYVVRVVGPTGTVSTVDTANPGDTTTPNNSVNNNDNGVGVLSNSVSANTFNMSPGVSGVVTNGNGTTTNNTIDFGFAYTYALGNRVWYDTNNNSLIDFVNELGVDGVTVQLYAAVGGVPSGPILATDTTINGGYYLFDGLFPGDYVVVLPASNFSGPGVLTGWWSSATTRATDGTISETTAALTELNIDSDDNGTRQTLGAFTNAIISSAVTLGPTGMSEPTGEHLSDVDINETGTEHQGLQADGRANMTVDFGFYRVEVGNLVFGDFDKDGLYVSGTDAPLSGITVELFTGDGITLIASTTTNLSGLYQFGSLPEGSYVIKVAAPAGMVSTIDSYDQTDNDTPTTNSDDNDNGDGTANGIVSSATGVNAVYLNPGDVQLNNTVTFTNGTTSNPTMDFGFSYLYALGNRLWFDTDNDSVIDASEVGVMDGVTVELWAADSFGALIGATALATDTTTTSGGNPGYYYFSGLEAGNYVVVIPATEFASSGPLFGYWSSATTRLNSSVIAESTAPIPNTVASDIDDNGTRQAPSGPVNPFDNAVLSGLVTLGPGPVEPALETDLETGTGLPDLQANMTVDFGFYTITLGDLVWNDVDNNGLVNAEAGMSNVDVQLWSQNLSTLIGTDTTDVNGNYSFVGLPQGNYILRIPASEFNPVGTLRDYISSTGAGAPYPYEPAPNAESNITNSDDNGTAVGSVLGSNGTYNSSLGLGGYIQSSIFALTPNMEDAGTSNNTIGLTSEPRVDFGVYLLVQTDLAVTKDDGVAFYIPGGTLNYTIVVTNKGPSDVIGAVVADALPPQIASWTWTCDAGNPVASNCNGGTTAPFQDTINLLQGESVTYHVVASITASPTGILNNTVTVTNPVNELVSSDNTDTDSDALASLQVSKDDGQTIISAGNTITYQIVVTNNGMMNLTSINVADTLPSDLIYVSAIPAPTTQAGNALTWSGISPLTNLAVGASTTISVTATVVASPSSTIANVVNVVDINTNTTATDNDVDSIASVPNNNITKRLTGTDASHTDDTQVTIGEILTYEVVMSVPTGSMTNAILVDTPQNGLAFADLTSLIVSDVDTDGAGADTGLSSSVMTFNIGGACNNCADGSSIGSNPLIGTNGTSVTFDFGTLANTSAATQTITIRYTVIVLDIVANQHSLGTTLANDVTWTWDGGNSVRPSPVPVVTVVEPEMTIDKGAQPLAAPLGAPITFTIDIAHSSLSSANAFDVVVTDVLPPGLAFIPGTYVFTRTSGTLLQAPVFNYDTGTTTLTFVWDEFQLGQSARLEFQAAFVGPSPVENSASLQWTSLEIDPSTLQRSVYNPDSTERWYDPLAPAGVNDYRASDSITIETPERLPVTGFAPGVVTKIPAMPADFSYVQTDLMVEIPRLGLKLNIVGVPFGQVNWDLTWLSSNAGWLEGSAFPTHAGNSALTAHAYLADGTAGPFSKLNTLKYGDQVIVHLGGQKYIYEVRQNMRVNPNTMSVLKHEELPWLTLITCQTYSERLDDYLYRIAVRAVLIKVE